MRMHSRRGVLALAFVGTAALVAIPVAASADEYPSWDDVLAARGDVKRKAAEIARIKGLLAKSQDEARAAEAVAEERGTVYQGVRARVDLASERLKSIREQVAEDREKAEAATQRAGQLAAQLTRTGGTDLETTLFFTGSDGGAATDFLTKLGRLSKLTEANGSIAAAAASARNTAAATQAQMKEVKDELVGLREEAKVALQRAVAASQEANEKVQREQDIQLRLQAQLDALEADSESTARAYQRGVAARRAAQRVGAGGAVGAGGWARPASGYITGRFGPRPDQPAGANLFHRGTDIGTGFGTPIYAAAAGTVVYAGWFGTYGYFVEVSHSDGISTGYAHIRAGGIFVRVGQTVTAGQNIASVGSTGASTGPHLHFETRLGGVAVDAEPFMAARGIPL